jgi:hypothetical protein
MSNMTDVEQERLDVAETSVERLLRLYKQKPRKGKDLKRLAYLEEALQRLQAARLL